MQRNQPQAAAGGSSSDNSLDFLWLVVIIVVSIALIWYFGKNYIANAVFYVRYYEIVAINYVLAGWNKFVQLSHLPLPFANTQNLVQWSDLIQSKPTNVSFNVLANLSTSVGNYLRYPIVVVLTITGLIVYFTNLTARFKTVYNMQRLKKIEQKNWPQITPVAKLNLIKQDLDEGPWAMAMTPMQFAKQNNLLNYEKDKHGKPTISLINGAAHRVMALQLGSMWTGLDKLPIHMQALFAIFAGRINRDREATDKLLLQISKSAENSQLDFTGTQELLAKNANNKSVRRVVGRHAYVYTVMASLLELARIDGVLASAEFLWLKPLDRKLWYMLNTVGRQTAVPEIAGAYAHWLAERKVGRPLKVPVVDEAVKGMDIALKELIYEPEDE